MPLEKISYPSFTASPIINSYGWEGKVEFDEVKCVLSNQKRIKDLEKERDNVAGQIAMAKEQLKDTGDLLTTLEDSKTVVLSCSKAAHVFII